MTPPGIGGLLAGKFGAVASTVTAGVIVPASAVVALSIPPSAVKRLASPLWKAQPAVFGVTDFARELTSAAGALGERLSELRATGREALLDAAEQADDVAARIASGEPLGGDDLSEAQELALAEQVLSLPEAPNAGDGEPTVMPPAPEDGTGGCSRRSPARPPGTPTAGRPAPA